MCPNSNTQTLYVPIDIGKNVHCYGAYAGSELEPVIAAQVIRSHVPGYREFRSQVQHLLQSQVYHRIVVGLEPTGVYHEPWANTLQHDFGDSIQLQMVTPFRTRQKRKQLFNRAERKTDEIDVIALGHCLRDGNGFPLRLPPQDLHCLDLWCRQHYSLKHEQRRLGNRIRSQIDRLWPGALVDVAAFKRAHPELSPPVPLVKTHPLQRQLVQVIMSIDPTPQGWADLSLVQIRTLLQQAGVRCGLKTAQKVLLVAQNACFLPTAAPPALVQRFNTDFLRYLDFDTELAVLRAKAESLVRTTPASVIATVPGITDFMAAQYAGLIADIRRFAHPDQIWALVGFDIHQHDSGDRRRRGKLTKRGLPYGRQVLFRMGFSASLSCSAIADARQRALHRGKSACEATIHAAHKTNRLCFHLYKHAIPFDPALSR